MSDAIETTAGATIEITWDNAPTGLVGTLGVHIEDGQGVTVMPRQTTGIVESPTTVYVSTITIPTALAVGQYVVTADTGGANPLKVTQSLTIVAAAGTFTYDPATAVGKVRLELGDTDSAAALFTDQEVKVYLDQNSQVILTTAAALCDVLATRFSREYDFQTDDQKFSRSQKAAAYRERAKELRSRASSVTSVPMTRVDGYSQHIDAEQVAVGDDGPGRRDWFTNQDRVF